MTISRKLFLGVLVFALPISVLVFFMDLSFVYDLDIARREQAGNRSLRMLYPALAALDRYRAELLLAELDPSVSPPSPQEVDSRVRESLEQLMDLDEASRARLGIDQAAMEDLHLADLLPERILETWRRGEVEETESPPASLPPLYKEVEDRLDRLFTRMAESSPLVLDPALDSNRLANVLARDIPTFHKWMTATLMHLRHEMDSDTADQILQLEYVAMLKGVVENHIRRDALAALAEDTEFYGVSPTLHELFGRSLAMFEKRADALVELLRDRAAMPPGEAPPPSLVTTWLAAHDAASDLFITGSRELDVLLDKRMDSYGNWRTMGYGFGLASLLIALFFARKIGASITRPVKSLVTYTDAIGQGRYQTELSGDFSGEMAGLADDITTMVGRLKDRLAFSQGILDAIVAPFLVCDPGSRITFANTAMISLMGVAGEPGEYHGMTLYDFFQGDGRMRELERQCFQERTCVENVEVRMENAAGAERIVSAFFSPIYDLAGDLMGVCVFLFDLTELRDREQTLAKQSVEIEQLAAFPMESPSPVLAADKHGAVIYTNLSAEMVLESLQLAMEDFLPPNHKDIVTNCLQSAYSRGQVEHTVRERVYSFTYNPLISHDMVQMHVLDITERKRMEEQLIHDAFHDGLTGLPNRALFLDRLTQALSRAKGRPDHQFAVMFLDMDRFKFINDSLGHAAGDELLIKFSQRLQLIIGPRDTLARLGGDEYTILLESVSGVSEALQMGENIQQALAKPFLIQGHEIFTSASVGIVVDNGSYMDHADLLRDADTAMYRAKAGGKARCEVFDPDMHVSARARLEMETALNKALEQDEFCVHYQPIVRLATAELAGFEALVRWQKDDGELVPPAEFIPLAEEMGLIERLGVMVLDRACRMGAAWNKRFSRKLMMSVNLSVRQFTSVTLVDDITRILDESRLTCDLLKLEVTESGVMGNVEQSLKLLHRLMDMGIRISIDDFGTGYSSLSYLHRFPFDYLKVDQSFVRNMDTGSENRDIVRTIVALAKDMGKQVIAEGIETPEQLAGLRQLGCDLGQGYLFARPMEGGQAEELLRTPPDWSFD